VQDKYLWLEDVLAEQSLDFVKSINAESVKKLKGHPKFAEIEACALKFFGTKDKIPYINLDEDLVYNHWTDDLNPQGILRRTSIVEFLNQSPKWEVIIDLDLLSKNENKKWVYKGYDLSPNKDKMLLFLSPGGSDANVVREFDLLKKEFIVDGFYLPESKGGAHYVSTDEIYLERKFDEASVTTSGYARTVRSLKRGQSLESANILFEIKKEEMYAYSKLVEDGDTHYLFFGKVIDFYNTEEYLIENTEKTLLAIPTMAEDHGVVNGKYLLTIKTDWNEYKMGDILEFDLKSKSSKLIFRPKLNQSVSTAARTKNGLYLIIDEDVVSSLYFLDQLKNYQLEKVELPSNGAINFLSTDHQSNYFFVTYSSFNMPPTYYFGEKNIIKQVAKSGPSFFDHEQIEVKQYFAISLDGTKVPYFLVHQKGIQYDGTNPTILYGYGGFEISLRPNFSNGIGASWLSHGGVYVLSNIRGGGEYGPRWHQAALKSKRHKAYEDFFAIAEDLIAKKITSPKHLGAMGGSNGGLLMGVCYTQRPDLFSAINCGVPLLDMHRYHQLLAGASWIAEYGDPEDESDGAYIRNISPYQNIKERTKYPVMFLNTSTKDDRVHPGHARKFAAKLKEYQYPVYYYENIDGGHAGASNYKESAFLHALDMCFFWTHLV
jgi:prolyl oligopeptidase